MPVRDLRWIKHIGNTPGRSSCIAQVKAMIKLTIKSGIVAVQIGCCSPGYVVVATCGHSIAQAHHPVAKTYFLPIVNIYDVTARYRRQLINHGKLLSGVPYLLGSAKLIF